MKHKSDHARHTIDTLFVITLFCIFAMCSILIIAVGAGVYKKTITNWEEHFTTGTSISYLTEKVRQSDASGSVFAGNYDGNDALVIKQVFNDEAYYTYIYLYDGYLKELFAKEDAEVIPEAGENIFEIKDFRVYEASDLITMTITDNYGKESTLTLSTKSN